MPSPRQDLRGVIEVSVERLGAQGDGTVEQRDLFRDALPPETLSRYVAAVFDPPRAGASKVVEALARSRFETIVAISCKPATFARDAVKLVDAGYRLERVTPIDQFVWTRHLELAAVFRRRCPGG